MCVHPNAGLPNPMAETGFDETPADTSALLEEFAQAGLVNMAGGCCGTTPEHIRAIVGKGGLADAARGARGAGQDPPVGPGGAQHRRRDLFVNVGERTNVTGSKMFARLVREEKYDEALAVARQQVENGAQIIDVEHGRGDAGLGGLYAPLPQPDRVRARHRAGAGDDRQFQVGSDPRPA